jgi:cell wall-associated NlpC family hydrolase
MWLEAGCELVGFDQVGAAEPGESAVQAQGVAYATGLLGTPYVFNLAGVNLPRVAQAQYDAGPQVRPADAVVPGDLVFFGSSPTGVEHVGMFVGNGLMIDAPHTGAVVRFDRVEGFGPIVGITSPGGQQIA